MATWTCGCGRANFSTAYPCMLCGAPAPTAQAQPVAVEDMVESSKRRISPAHIAGGFALVVAIAALVWFGGRPDPRHPTQFAAADKQAAEIKPFETTTTTAPALSPLDVVLVKPPRDFQEVAVDGEKNGPLGLADAESPAERRLLRDAHFMGGYEHVWQRIGAPDVIMKMVFEFETEQYATNFYDGYIARGVPAMPGGQIPGAVMGASECECFIKAEGIAYRKGNRVFSIFAGTTNGRFIPAEATALALEQYKAI